MQKAIILVLLLIILSTIFVIPPSHWVIIGILIFLIAFLSSTVVSLACSRGTKLIEKKRRISIITGIVVFLILTIQSLQVLTPLNALIIILLGMSLLAL